MTWQFFSIADIGVGMDEETIKHIFEKYYQGEEGSTFVIKSPL
jgi:signal transduction histidine kinase